MSAHPIEIPLSTVALSFASESGHLSRELGLTPARTISPPREPLPPWSVRYVQPPAPDPEAGGDCVSMRLVHGTPCLVLERDEWPDGGIATEEQLIAAKIPFIRTNEVTRDYMASRTVSDGTTTIETRFDHGGCPIVGVSIRDGLVLINTEELADIQRLVELQWQILAVPAAVAATG